ncbi:MAG: phosphate transport system regulator PhoU, partial [Betaproteobacteria bacterium]|nr:phosphate transport system regulator PhoU [Betaproteobacteria bacterium]
MNIDQHTVKKFDAELEGLRAQILKMGGLVEDQIAQALNALTTGDLALCEQVERGDR